MHPLRSAGYWLAVVLGMLILVPTLWYFISADPGRFAYVAWAWLVKRQPPYINLIGPYLMNYLAFKLFGPSFFSVRLLDYFFQTFNIALIAYFCHLISPPKLRTASGIAASILYASFYLNFKGGNTILKDGFALTPLLLAAAVFIWSPQKWKALKAIFIGLMIGIAFLFKPTFGLAGVAFAVLYLVRERKAKTSWGQILLLEFLLFVFAWTPFFICAAGMVRMGIWGKFLEVFYTFNTQGYLKTGGGYLANIKFWDFVAYTTLDKSQMLWFGAFIFLLIHLSRSAWQDSSATIHKIVILSLTLVAALSVFLQAKGHMYYIIPLAGFSAVLAGDGFSWLAAALSDKMAQKLKGAVAVLVLLSVLALQIASLSFQNIVFLRRNLFKPLQYAYANQTHSLELAKYIEERTKPDDPILCFGNFSEVAFLARRVQSTSVLYHQIVVAREAGSSFLPIQIKWQKELVQDLKKNPPVYFLIEDTCKCSPNPSVSYYEALNELPELEKFLDENYKLETTMAMTKVYKLIK